MLSNILKFSTRFFLSSAGNSFLNYPRALENKKRGPIHPYIQIRKWWLNCLVPLEES